MSINSLRSLVAVTFFLLLNPLPVLADENQVPSGQFLTYGGLDGLSSLPDTSDDCIAMSGQMTVVSQKKSPHGDFAEMLAVRSTYGSHASFNIKTNFEIMSRDDAVAASKEFNKGKHVFVRFSQCKGGNSLITIINDFSNDGMAEVHEVKITQFRVMTAQLSSICQVLLSGNEIGAASNFMAYGGYPDPITHGTFNGFRSFVLGKDNPRPEYCDAYAKQIAYVSTSS